MTKKNEEYFKEKYKFKLSESDKLEEEWALGHIKMDAANLRDMIPFTYFIELDPDKFYAQADVSRNMIRKEFKNEYCYPNRELGDHTIVIGLYGYYCDKKVLIRDKTNEVYHLYAVTNVKRDAVEIKLRYA